MDRSSNVRVIRQDGSEEVVDPWGKPIRGKLSSAMRDFVVLRDQGACRYCGKIATPIHVDHVIAVANGGKTEIDNLVVACVPCNRKKGTNPWEPIPLGRFRPNTKISVEPLSKQAYAKRKRERANKARLRALNHRNATGLVDNRIKDAVRKAMP